MAKTAQRNKTSRARAGGSTRKGSAKRPARAPRKAEQEARAPSRGSQRALWSGQVRLALVSVPVNLFAATSAGARLSFHQVHEPSGKRIRYEKVVPGIGPVDTDEIVKGFEISSGEYVLLSQEEIDAVKLEARRTIDLVQFVDHADIDPIWFERPYYVAPDGELAEEAYSVLRDALRATKKVGIGQFVMRGREYVAALKPCGRGLLLETLRFADEVREAAPYFAGIDEAKADPELLSLAEELIGRKSAPFDPARFQDDYTETLRGVIEAKVKKRKPVAIEEEEPARGAKVIDLVEALRKSVAGQQESRRSRARRKTA